VDIFDREAVFIDEVLAQVTSDFSRVDAQLALAQASNKCVA
jgi:dihydroorotase